MKRLLLFLAASLGLNAALVAALVWKPALAPSALRGYFGGRTAASGPVPSGRAPVPAPAAAKADAEAAQRARLWAALDTDDLPALIARLRAAGFSPVLIRAIVTAKIEGRFSARMAALVGPMQDTPYWKPVESGGPFGESKFWEERSQIYRERSRLLREVLGDGFFADTDPAAAQRRQFGDIPKWKVDLIQRITDDYGEMSAQVRAAMQGVTLPEDREKLALLERERRADLAQLLTAEELEAYDLRNSPIASRLRLTMGVMDASEAEFRAIYRVQQQFDERINPRDVTFISQEMSQQMSESRRLMNDELRATLGPERYADFLRASDREFQQLQALASREQVAADAILRAYNLREDYARRSTAIMADDTLNPEQKRAALQNLGQDARAQLIGTLGHAAGSAYAQNSRWVRQVENGGSFSITDGSMRYRNPPPPQK